MQKSELRFPKKANEFLTDGDKIKVTIRFRGRQVTHPEIGKQVMLTFYDIIQEKANIDRQPILEGRNMIMILSPKEQK